MILVIHLSCLKYKNQCAEEIRDLLDSAEEMLPKLCTGAVILLSHYVWNLQKCANMVLNIINLMPTNLKNLFFLDGHWQWRGGQHI